MLGDNLAVSDACSPELRDNLAGSIGWSVGFGDNLVGSFGRSTGLWNNLADSDGWLSWLRDNMADSVGWSAELAVSLVGSDPTKGDIRSVVVGNKWISFVEFGRGWLELCRSSLVLSWCPLVSETSGDICLESFTIGGTSVQ